MRLDLGLENYEHSEALIIQSLRWTCIGLACLLLAYRFGKQSFKRFCYHPIRIKEYASSPLVKWIILIGFILSLFFVFWKKIGAIPMMIEDYHQSGRAELGQGLGLIEAFAKSAANLSIAFYIWYFRDNRTISRFVIVFSLVIVGIFLLNDERGGLINYIIMVAMVYYIYVSRFTIKQYLLMLLAMVMLAGFIGVMRERDASGMLRLGYTVATESSVEFDNYVEVFNMCNNGEHLGGSTLVPIATIPIPRAIFPEKNQYLTAGEYFKEYHGHSHIRVGERITFIGELYLNWGGFGVIIGMILLGLFISFIEKTMCRSPHVVISYFYIQLVFFSVSLITGDIASAVVGFFMSNILMILIVGLLKLLGVKPTKRVGYN